MDRPIDTAKTMKPKIIRFIKAAEMIGVSKATLYKYAKQGKFTIVKRGTMSYVPTHQVEAYLDPSAE